MNKTLKILIGIVIGLIILWGIIFYINYNRCSNFKMPIFVIEGEKESNTSIIYYGLGYQVKTEFYISETDDLQLENVEMYFLNKVIAAAIAQKEDEPDTQKLHTTEGITTALTLEDEIQNDTIWCGTFQLIWNDLKNNLAKKDIIFNPQLKVVENLNKETFTTNDISDKYYYKKIGNPTIDLKKEIEKAIKDKFNEKSDILDEFNWENRDTKDYFLYAMLKKEFEFEKEFEELEKSNFGEYENIKYFGIKSDKTGKIREQVEVLYYNSEDDFAIKLKTKQEDEVILCKNPQSNTFNEIYKNITEQEKIYDGEKSLQEEELLKIPNISLKEKKEFKDIENKPFFFSNGDEYIIEKAIQTIEFELDNKGGRIKSEAGMMSILKSSVMEAEEKRQFFIDDRFAIFLIEENKNMPYFAAIIDDITKFQ